LINGLGKGEGSGIITDVGSGKSGGVEEFVSILDDNSIG